MKFSIEDAPVMFRALADSTRLKILDALLDGDRSVSELCAELKVAQPFCSRHLAVLRHADLVVQRREAQRAVYSLHPALRVAKGRHRTLGVGFCVVRFPARAQ